MIKMRFLDKLRHKKIPDDKRNSKFFFDFEKKVPYSQYRHDVMSVGDLIKDRLGFCKRASSMIFTALGDISMVGIEIRCFDIKSDKLEDIILVINKSRKFFESIGIEATLNRDKSGFFSKDTDPKSSSSSFFS